MGIATQQILLGSSLSAPERTYVDDVFSTFLYEGSRNTNGSGSSDTINNGIDLAGEGGMIWLKGRTSQPYDYAHGIFDTVRGKTKNLQTQSTGSESVYPGAVSSFNSNGFTLNDGTYNWLGSDYTSFSFKKSPGFFDVKQFTWSNSNSTQSINHDLGSVPGLVILKASNSQNDWRVYHRDLGTGDDAMLALNQDYAAHGYNTSSNNNHFVSVTDTAVTVRSLTGTVSYIMYIFAGGESSESGATSVSFDGVTYNQRLDIADTSDLEISNSEFTMECWFRQDTNSGSGSNSHTLLSKWDNDGRKEFIFRITENNSQQCLHWLSSSNGSSNDANLYGNSTITNGVWNHAAVTRDSSGKIRMFLNGLLQENMGTQASTHANSHEFMIGANGTDSVTQYMSGDISNVRFIKGQCLWTSSFRPTNEPLTTTSQGAISSNVKLLCCNDSSPTGSTVTPGTITNFNALTASTDSPFDDPAGFVFGDSGTENIIKCGSYRGDPSSHSNPTEVNVGFEPQWVLIKASTDSKNWVLIDSMRKWTGDTSDGAQNAEWLEPNTSNNGSNGSMLTLTSTGFIARQSSYTGGNNTFVYMAIRRNDGYVGKPADAGTDVFTAVYDTSGVPMFKTPNHDVDFTFQKDWNNASNDWNVSARLMEGRRLETNTPNAEEFNTYQMGDYSRGWSSYTGGDGSRIGYNFKRHTGMDVVVYKGTGANLSVNHSLNGVPELMWCKERDNAGTEWKVHHKDRGPSNILRLNNALAEETNQDQYQNTSPTATQFFVKSSLSTPNAHFLAVLFRSINGISKVGSYIGTDVDINLSFGFTPRLFIVKMADGVGSWHVFDTTRGITSNGAPRLELNLPAAQNTSAHYVEPYTNGIKIVESGAALTDNGKTYIYYAHA